MKLINIKTLKEISVQYGIPATTLQTRLTLKSFNLIEGTDYRRLGKGQSIIFSTQGVNKITRNKSDSKNIKIQHKEGF